MTAHTVVSGDFCAWIASAVGIDPSMLLTNNPIVNVDCSTIYPDEVRVDRRSTRVSVSAPNFFFDCSLAPLHVGALHIYRSGRRVSG